MIFSKHHKPLSLSAQIRATERRVSHRQQQIGIHTAAITQKIGRQLATPPNLMLASGVGFIIGELTKQAPGGEGNNGQATQTSPLKRALNLFSSIRTLYTALPLVWIMASAYETKAAKPISEQKTVALQSE